MKVARAGLSNSERATHSAIGRSILGRPFPRSVRAFPLRRLIFWLGQAGLLCVFAAIIVVATANKVDAVTIAIPQSAGAIRRIIRSVADRKSKRLNSSHLGISYSL